VEYQVVQVSMTSFLIVNFISIYILKYKVCPTIA